VLGGSGPSDLVAAIKAGGHEVAATTISIGARFSAMTTSPSSQTDWPGGVYDDRPRSSHPLSCPPWACVAIAARHACEPAIPVLIRLSARPRAPARGYIQWLIKKNMVPGPILHDGVPDPTRSTQALPEILAEGQRRGIRFVSIGELLQERGGGRTRRCS
jgi:hypothetical protein